MDSRSGGPSPSSARDRARRMASFRNGDHEGTGRLVEIFYPELRRIADARMRAERRGHTPSGMIHVLPENLISVANSMQKAVERMPPCGFTRARAVTPCEGAVAEVAPVLLGGTRRSTIYG